MSNVPTISYTTSHGPPHTRREPYAQRRASRERHLQSRHPHQARDNHDNDDNAYDYARNPYLSHLRTRARGAYTESEVSSSSFGGTSVLSGSVVGSSSSQGYSHNGTTGMQGQGTSASPKLSRSSSGGSRDPYSYSSSPPILAPIPQRNPYPSFSLNPSSPNPNTNSNLYLQPPNPATITTSASLSPSSKVKPRRSQHRRIDEAVDTPLRRLVRHLSVDLGAPSWAIVLWSLGLVGSVKWLVGLGGYSGQGASPRFGDFEAQRFWMDLTINEPFSRWYTIGGVDDGDWWRLDYPPLTAYISWVFGKIGHYLLPRHFAGKTSRGAESAALKTYMRWTVLALESISWWPVVVVWCWSGWGVGTRSKRTRIVTILSILLQPSLVLIDNGHFQYNSFPLGMTLLSVYLFQRGNDLLGAVAFSASLLFKQMGLYWSPAVFGYLLGKCIWVGGDEGLTLFIKIGATTATTFLLAFAPFLRPFPQTLLILLERIFPLQRGIFEDKVANFWCASNVVLKWKNWFAAGSMAKLATLATLVGIAPTLGILLWTSYRLRCRPSSTAPTPPQSPSMLPPIAPLLPLALFTSSMAFFLFSFQVHEKSVLVPLLSVLMLLGEKGEGDGIIWDGIVGLLNVATFSMYPLLKRDDQTLQYIVWTLGWNYLVGYNPVKVVDLKMRWFGYAVYAFVASHHLMEAFVPPSSRYPDIYPVTNVLLSFSIFSLAWLVASWKLLEMAVGMVGLGDLGSERPVSSSANVAKKDK